LWSKTKRIIKMLEITSRIDSAKATTRSLLLPDKYRTWECFPEEGKYYPIPTAITALPIKARSTPKCLSA